MASCIHKGLTLDALPLEEYRGFSELFEADLFDAIDLQTCVSKRTSPGGPGAESIKAQIDYLLEVISE